MSLAHPFPLFSSFGRIATIQFSSVRMLMVIVMRKTNFSEKDSSASPPACTCPVLADHPHQKPQEDVAKASHKWKMAELKSQTYQLLVTSNALRCKSR